MAGGCDAGRDVKPKPEANILREGIGSRIGPPLASEASFEGVEVDQNIACASLQD